MASRLLFFAFFLLAGFTLRTSAQPLVTRAPWYETAADSTSITITWSVPNTIGTELFWGLTLQYELGDKPSAVNPDGSDTLTATISGLRPATCYYIKVRTVGTNLDSITFVASTASDYRSTDSILVFFNRSVDSTSYPNLPHANGNTALLPMLLDRIAAATHSIDLALYSFTGSTGTAVGQALMTAQQRGIKVRMIVDSASVAGSSAYALVRDAGIPIIRNSFGNNGTVASYIHHNKFIILDGREDDGRNVWVEAGSWNLSDEQTTTDYQNVLLIQDLALARAYEREFNQEWGSSGDQPDPVNARFSTHKLDITPRSFWLRKPGTDKLIETHLLFSPNRGCASSIDFELKQARQQILYALFVFTRSDLAQDMILQHSHGLDIHGIVNDTDQYEQTPMLRQAGIDALRFTGGANVLLHHKYCLLDAGYDIATVITGSFNWSATAEQHNSENLLIIKDKDIAGQYFQEFLQRYRENGGTASISYPKSSVPSYPSNLPKPSSLRLYPNPSSGPIRIAWNQLRAGEVRVSVLDEAGRCVEDFMTQGIEGENQYFLALPLPLGCYRIVVQHDAMNEQAGVELLH